MINIVADNWYEAWYELHRAVAEEPETTIDQRFSTRGVSFTNNVRVLHNELGKLHHSLVGYSMVKVNAFDRKYIIPGHKEEIGEKIIERIIADRKLTVLSYGFKQSMKAHGQGSCVINILITMRKMGKYWNIKFDIYMRIGEITRRIAVDFIKFYEIIDYWLSLLKDYNMQVEPIEFHSGALYAEPLSLTISEYIFGGRISFTGDHWIHKAVQTKLSDYENKELKFKRARRIKKYVQRLQGEENVSS